MALPRFLAMLDLGKQIKSLTTKYRIHSSTFEGKKKVPRIYLSTMI